MAVTDRRVYPDSSAAVAAESGHPASGAAVSPERARRPWKKPVADALNTSFAHSLAPT